MDNYISILMNNKPTDCEKCMFWSERLEQTDDSNTLELKSGCMFNACLNRNCPIIQCDVEKMEQIENDLLGK